MISLAMVFFQFFQFLKFSSNCFNFSIFFLFYIFDLFRLRISEKYWKYLFIYLSHQSPRIVEVCFSSVYRVYESNPILEKIHTLLLLCICIFFIFLLLRKKKNYCSIMISYHYTSLIFMKMNEIIFFLISHPIFEFLKILYAFCVQLYTRVCILDFFSHGLGFDLLQHVVRANDFKTIVSSWDYWF